MYNIVVLGTSCFDGMASSKRVMNLMRPLMEGNLIKINNLIYQRDLKNKIKKKGSLDNINFRVIKLKMSNILTIFPFLINGMLFLKKNKLPNHKNIIYSYGSVDMKNVLFIMYGKLIGYKIIFDIVEDNRYEKSVSRINNMRVKSSLFLLKHFWNLADSIIVISDHLSERMLSIVKGKIPLYLIPISVDLKYFQISDYRPDKEDIKIFYGGSYGEKDGLEYLINAFEVIGKKYQNVRLILTGVGHKNDMNKIDAQINGLENKHKIIFKGFLNTEDYYKLLNESDIFCMTRINSKYANAGFPFKLGEFLASGKAVIATDVGDVSKYLSNNIDSLVICPDSVPSIVDALSLLIENPDKIKSLGSEARKTAEQFFNSEKISIQLLKIFDSV